MIDDDEKDDPLEPPLDGDAAAADLEEIVDIAGHRRIERLIRRQRDLALRLGAAGDLSRTLGVCLDATMEIADMDAGGVYVVDGAGDLELVVTRGLTETFIESRYHFSADSPHGRLVQAGRSVFASSDDGNSLLSGEQGDEGLRSLCMLPISNEGRIIACINVASHEHATISAEVRATLESVSSQVGVAIARAQAEERLRQSEERYRSFVANASEGIYRIDLTEPVPIDLPLEELAARIDAAAVVGEVNEALSRMYDLSPEDMVGRPATDFAPDYGLRGALVAQAPHHRVTGVETNDRGPGGRPLHLSENFTGVVEEGLLTRIWGMQRDVSRRRKAEEERLAHVSFLESLEKLDQVIRGASDPEQMLEAAIALVFELFGCDRAWLLHPCDPETPSFRVPIETARPEYPGAGAMDVDIQMMPSMRADMIAALAAEGPVACGPGNPRPMAEDTARLFGVQSQIFECVFPKIGKPWLLGIQHCETPRVWDREEIRLLHEIGRRIADGLTSLLFLRDLTLSEERYRLLAQNASDVIWTTDLGFVATFLSPSANRLLRVVPEEIVGRPLAAGLTPASAELAMEMVAEELAREEEGTHPPSRSRTLESEWRRGDGGTVWLETTASFLRDDEGRAVGILGISRDITERRRAEAERQGLEDQLRQSQKMEAVGRLAGGVAHDFNNIMTGIIGYSEMLLGSIEPGDPLQADVEEILRAGERAASLTSQLLAFSRKQVIAPRVIRPNEVLERSGRMLRRIIGEDIDLDFVPGAQLGRIKADAAQLDEILVNLAVNARDAMPEGGKLTIETHNVELDEARCRSLTDARPGPHVMLRVTDSGVGMDEPTQQRIFEPFFTTKSKDKGTGLGLATVYGVVRQNGGFITVDSELGEGSTFEIYFPRVFEEAGALRPRADDPLPKGTETVLLVEDEDMVRSLALRILKRQGYRVIEAEDGAAALQACAQHDGPIDLLLVDVIMPGINGRELEERLLERLPDLKVLFMSGYTEDVIGQQGVLDVETQFLQKPFTIESLAKKVRVTLDS